MSKKFDQQRMESSEDAFYRDFFEGAPDMFAAVDPESGLVTQCNDTLCRTLGFEKSELVGQPVQVVYTDDCADEVDSVHRSIARSGKARSNQLSLKRRDGTSLDVSLNETSHRNSDGNVVENRYIWRELTLERQVEMLELELRLQQVQKIESLALLAGGISHDFNNLLVGILGNANLGVAELAPESPVRHRFASIEVSAQRAADLTRQLLAYSGSQAREHSTFDIGRIVEEMGHLLEVAISRSVVLRIEVAKEAIPVSGEITQIRQVVMNLLLNASEAIGDASGLVTVRTGIQHASRSYLDGTLLGEEPEPGYFGFVEVADTGSGMTPEQQRRMFDPFFTTKEKGHGLGLAAVLGIVRSHGGCVRVYSEENRGTTIRIMLPLVDAEVAIGEGAAEHRSAQGEHVLLVDDEEHVRAITMQMLEHAGFTVTCLEDGRQATDFFRLQHTSIDIVLMDVTMPHIDGASAFLEMQRINASIPVVLMSGHVEKQATHSLAGRNVAGFIQKPFVLKNLVEMLIGTLDSFPDRSTDV